MPRTRADPTTGPEQTPSGLKTRPRKDLAAVDGPHRPPSPVPLLLPRGPGSLCAPRSPASAAPSRLRDRAALRLPHPHPRATRRPPRRPAESRLLPPPGDPHPLSWPPPCSAPQPARDNAAVRNAPRAVPQPASRPRHQTPPPRGHDRRRSCQAKPCGPPPPNPSPSARASPHPSPPSSHILLPPACPGGGVRSANYSNQQQPRSHAHSAEAPPHSPAPQASVGSPPASEVSPLPSIHTLAQEGTLVKRLFDAMG